LLPDDVIAAEKPCLLQMVEAHAETGGCMVAAMEVAPAKRTSSYGVLDIAEDMGAIVRPRAWWKSPRPKMRRRIWR
jgi:UTP--glucose-1-phosphate uridylyltransferase